MCSFPTLYSICLRKVVCLIRQKVWNSNIENTFCSFPSKLVDDLTSTVMLLLPDFRADDLKLLLTSGQLRKFNFDPNISFDNLGPIQQGRKYKELEQGFIQALKFLSSASHNLEVLRILGPFGGYYGIKVLCFKESPDKLQEAVTELLLNSPNLKHLHCKQKFDLRILKKCKKLQNIMLHFEPEQPWYDFLDVQQGNRFQPLESLEVFKICHPNYGWTTISKEKQFEYIQVLLTYCPALAYLGNFETSKILAHLFRTNILPHVKLRRCSWATSKPDRIRDATKYVPHLEELTVSFDSIQSIRYLSNLRNLVLLSIWSHIKSDISLPLATVFKDIGVNLKHLAMFNFSHTVDINMLLKCCPNLEAFLFSTCDYQETKVPETPVSLPKLKYLSLTGRHKEKRRVLHFFSDCHNLMELFVQDYLIDDKTLDLFLRRNSLTNLKVAYFEDVELKKQDLRTFLLNAPKLEKINVIESNKDLNNSVNCLNSVLSEIDHKALSFRSCISINDEFLTKKLMHPCS